MLGCRRVRTGEARAENVEAFSHRLRRAAHDRRVHGLASAVVQFFYDGKRSAELATAVVKQRRTTDAVFASRRRDGGETVTLLLPMTDDLGVARYLGRVETAVREATGASLREAGGRVEHTAIEVADRIAALDLGNDSPAPLDDDEPQPHKLARH